MLLDAYISHGAGATALLGSREGGWAEGRSATAGQRAYFRIARIRQSAPAVSLVVRLGSAAGRVQLARSARQCGSPRWLLLLAQAEGSVRSRRREAPGVARARCSSRAR